MFGGVFVASVGCTIYSVAICNLPDDTANDNEPAFIPVVYFLHADHIGRPQYATTQDGSVIWSDGIKTPFGEAVTTAGAFTQNLMFPGQYEDAETGLSHNWHRTYDSVLRAGTSDAVLTSPS